MLKRRNFIAGGASALGLAIALTYQHAQALSLADLSGISDSDASKGLKAALEKGALSAVALLGRTDGFLGNEKVRIPLPHFLEEAGKILRATGKKAQVDELVTSINRAAEAAVPMSKTLLVNAVKNMSVTDAKKILTGGNTSVTQFFAEKTRSPLSGTFLPVVHKATAKVGLAQKYDAVAGKAAGLGLVKKEDAKIDNYVTGKTLDGLYLVIGEEEKKIRQDPVSAGSAIVKKVFGAIKK
ncbi:MAG: hypothetical protein RLZZ271_25 [Pseudomonadota bacterium]|jgi:hypothetical protein